MRDKYIQNYCSEQERQEIIKVLKKCLNKGNCTQCKYGKYGQPMMCCRELIKTILDKLEGRQNDE